MWKQEDVMNLSCRFMQQSRAKRKIVNWLWKCEGNKLFAGESTRGIVEHLSPPVIAKLAPFINQRNESSFLCCSPGEVGLERPAFVPINLLDILIINPTSERISFVFD